MSEKLTYLKSEFKSQASTAIITSFGISLVSKWEKHT
jgi:hypothetical protein